MTKEEKQLLIKDLCGRLPYGVRVKQGSWEHTLESANMYNVSFDSSFAIPIPYLRPLSSMTAKEEYEYHQCKNFKVFDICEMEYEEILETTALCFSRATDWLDKNKFDYRGLIPMGLALEAPEGMYE